MSLFDLKNKVAIITGGAGALGGSIAESLAEAGVKTVVMGRTQKTVDEKASLIKSKGGEALGIAADVLNEEQLNSARNDIMDQYGTIDILINAAGGNMPGATIADDQSVFDLSMDALRNVTDLNFMGTVLPSLVFGKVMADKKRGVIINVSSMAADRALTRVAGYSASKAAMENFTKWMAVDLALKFGEGVRVNAIAPGFFIGDQNRALLTNEDGSYTDRGNKIINNTPMKRFGEAEEINGAIHYLCSEASKFVTGIVIPVDGGFSSYSGV